MLLKEVLLLLQLLMHLDLLELVLPMSHDCSSQVRLQKVQSRGDGEDARASATPPPHDTHQLVKVTVDGSRRGGSNRSDARDTREHGEPRGVRLRLHRRHSRCSKGGFSDLVPGHRYG